MEEIECIDAYREVEALRKSLKIPIMKMPRYERYNYGDRMINLMLDIKIHVKLTYEGKNCSLDKDMIFNKLITLKVIMDECIDNESLVLSGRYNIIESIKRLETLLTIFS